jgi:hypothetical protein
MHGAELLVQYFMAERQREARQASLARKAAESREKPKPRSVKRVADGQSPRRAIPGDDRSWMPRLRGYPVDPSVSHR